MEEQRRAEENRLKGDQESGRKRALNMMMGGRLEDRSEREEKEDLVPPPCYSKPEGDLTEDEKRLVKEYEQKVAAIKVHSRIKVVFNYFVGRARKAA